LQLELLSRPHAVVRLDPDAAIPPWAQPGGGAGSSSLLSLTRTAEELSVVCPEQLVPEGVDRSGGWRALRVAGTLDHGMTGVLSSLAVPLAEAAIPIFVVSTFDTDYLLVPESGLGAAIRALRVAGHEVDHPEGP
jgi:hypothetical protein